MFSLQRALGKDDAFLELLHRSASEACASVESLKLVLNQKDVLPTLDTLAASRRKEKQLTADISEMLVKSFVIAMDREDIEGLAGVLYRIPKTVEKFAERYIIAAQHVRDVDFSRQLDLMSRACSTTVQMVQALKDMVGLAEIKQLNANMQKIESDADDLVLELTAQFYKPGYPSLKAVIVKDLIELNEKVVDRCRDAGNLITRVALKNS